MPGQRQKAPELLANGRGGRGRGLEIVASGPRTVPTHPVKIGAHARAVWRRFFRSWVADAVTFDADGEQLEHWIRCVDERALLLPRVQAEPLVRGSMGQMVENPLRRTIDRLTKDINRAEDHFGMTALSRWRLQLTVSEAGRSQNELRKSLLTPVQNSVDADGVIDLDALE